MIIRRFLLWSATASAEARALGAAALSRAFVNDEFEAAERLEAAAAMMALLDDPTPAVRLAMAVEVAAAPNTPSALVSGLCADRSDIAALVLEFSPVLALPELIDAVAVGDRLVQCAVARRLWVDVGLAAALAEVACVAACIELCRNEAAIIAESTFVRLLARFGESGALRAAVADRADLPAALRHDLVVGTARTLAAFVTSCGWLGAERAARATEEAVAEACLTIAATSQRQAGQGGVVRLVRHLRVIGSLTPALILRALLCGNVAFFEASLSELAGVALVRVSGLLDAGRGLGFRSLYDRAGLPAALRPAFAAALDGAGSARFAETGQQRDRIRRVIAACQTPTAGPMGSLMALLRRLDVQAAREEARDFTLAVRREATVLRLPRLSAADRSLPPPSSPGRSLPLPSAA